MLGLGVGSGEHAEACADHDAGQRRQAILPEFSGKIQVRPPDSPILANVAPQSQSSQ